MPLLPSTRYLLACGLAPLLFVVVLLIEGATRPGHDPIHRFGSELSWATRDGCRSPTLSSPACWCSPSRSGCGGCCTWAAARWPAQSSPGCSAVLNPGILAGVFVMDPVPGYPPGVTVLAMPTLSNTLHGLAGVAAFWSAGAAAALSLVEPGGQVDTDLDTLVIALCVKIDDTLQQAPELRPWRPAVGIAPKLTDAELLTLARGSTTPEVAHVALLMMRGPGPHVEPPP